MTNIVRRATPADAPAIARLNLAFDDLRTTPEQIAAHIAHRAQFETPFVAELAGDMVGLACLRLLPAFCDSTPYAELTGRSVDPAHQRRGIGRALVRRIEDEARAHAFYHALGYGLYTVTMRRPLGRATVLSSGTADPTTAARAVRREP